ncbi:RHS repeat-associated core domain-containing protein, partial [Rathayibacter rathayi]
TPGGVTGVGDHWSDPGWRPERSTTAHDPWNPTAATPVADGIGLTPAGALTFAGLEWMGHRAYDPTTRGFLSTDPLSPTWGAAWSGNPYSFAGNDPVHALDPTGLSPITDAQLQAYRDGNNGALAAAGDWFAHNWEYIAGGAMALAGGALMFTGVGGPLGAALVGAGIDVIIQKATTGSVNWAQTALTAVTGGLGSSMTAARLGAAGINGLKAAVASEAASGAASGAAGDAYAYATAPGPHTLDGFLQASGGGALTGAAMGASGPLLGRGLTGAGRAAAGALETDLTHAREALGKLDPRPVSPRSDVLHGPIPEKPTQLLDRLDTTGEKFPNIKGGQRWNNDPKPGHTRLPTSTADGTPIEYKEYELDPKIPGQRRPSPRVVTGDDGSTYYSPDHYHNFFLMRE